MGRLFNRQPENAHIEFWQTTKRTIEVAERFADGVATEHDRRAAAEASQAASSHYGDIAASAPSPGDDPNYDDAAVTIGCDVGAAAECAASILPSAAELMVRVAATFAAYDNEAYYAGAHGYSGASRTNLHLVARRAERVGQWTLLADIFGDPFRSPVIDSSWLTWNDGTVFNLAQAIYNDSRFQDLPVLADALEEAGCNNVEILNHCRQPGVHVRGCWALDLILGKE